MIVTVCADKGSPGVSTVATLLAMVWPGERLLLEADPSGGDAALWLRTPTGQRLPRTPTVHALCVDVRGGVMPGSLLDYAHSTSLGVPVIAATDLSSGDLALVARQWPQVASAAAGWPGMVIADVGRLQEGNPAGALALAATVVLLVCRATPTGLFHLRERAASLVERLGQGLHGRSPLAVAVICPARDHTARLGEVRELLADEPATSGVPVAGWVADDPRAVADLHAGTWTRRLERGDLVASVSELATALMAQSPELTVHLRGEPDPIDLAVPADPGVFESAAPAALLAPGAATNPVTTKGVAP